MVMFWMAALLAALFIWNTRFAALLRVVAPCKMVLVIPNPVILMDLVTTIPHSVQKFVFSTIVSPSKTLAEVTALVSEGKVLLLFVVPL